MPRLYIEIDPGSEAQSRAKKRIEVTAERERDVLIRDGDTVVKGQEIVAPLPFSYERRRVP